MLAGCGTTSRIFQKGATVPVVEKVEVTKYVALPVEHLLRGTPARAKNRTVGEYVRVANTNTALLYQCYRQLEEIEKLQP
jgi:hypothetical protein